MKDRWNLQWFAEGEDGGAPDDKPQGNDGGTDGKGSENPFDTFLKEGTNQAEFDRRVAKALETQKAKLDAANKSAIEEARTEAEKLAKMNAEQKAAYELEKLQKENAELKALQARAAMGEAAAKLLREAKIDATTDVLDLVVSDTAEKTQANISKLSGIIEAQLKAAEAERAKGRTPQSYNNDGHELSELEKRIAKYKKEG